MLATSERESERRQPDEGEQHERQEDEDSSVPPARRRLFAGGNQRHRPTFAHGRQAVFGTPIAAASPASDSLLVATSATDGHLVASSWRPKTGWKAWSTIG